MQLNMAARAPLHGAGHPQNSRRNANQEQLMHKARLYSNRQIQEQKSQ
jgi:hypothetical protein